MARIVYKPHCSECGAIINDKIRYEKIKLESLSKESGFIWDEYIYNIYPMKCEVCGEYFDCIEIAPPINLAEERDYDR